MSSGILQVLVLYNGRIVTMDPASTVAEAIAIDTKQGTVIETGSNTQIKHKYHTELQVDLGGRTMVPGLCDSHLHFIRCGLNFNLEIRWDGVESLAQGLNMIRQHAARTPPGQWVRVVGGWNEHQFTEHRLPTIAELDEAGGQCPVFVLHLYDCALVNSVGLRLLGYDQSTPNPPSGEIQRDAKGNPTGVLIARPNAFLLYNTLNKLPKLDFQDQINSTLAYQRECHRFGLTSCLDPGGGFQNFPDDYAVIQQLDKQQKLAVRIGYSLFPQKPKHELEDFRRWSKMVKPGDGSKFLRHIGAGEMLAFTAADFEDFKEARPDLPADMENDLEEIVRFLVSIKWPFRLHATYGESIHRELAIFEKVEQEHPGSLSSLHWFIDHAETITTQDIQRIRALGGGIAIQHRMAFQGEYFVQRYGQVAASNAPPIQSMLEAGLPVGAGTDGTRVATYNPWISVYWLVSGRTVGGLNIYPDVGGWLNVDNKQSRMDALRLWTQANNWFDSHAEPHKGTLMPGALADLAVLNVDYLSVPVEGIKKIEAEMTIVDGKVVYVDPSSRLQVPAACLSPLARETLSISPPWSPVKDFGGYQLTGSTAWTTSSAGQSAPAAAAFSNKQTKDETVNVASGTGGGSLRHQAHLSTAPADPAEFFMYGHDC